MADDYQIMGNQIPNAVTKLPGQDSATETAENGGAWVTKPRRIVVSNQLPLAPTETFRRTSGASSSTMTVSTCSSKTGSLPRRKSSYVGSLNADVFASEQEDVSQYLSRSSSALLPSCPVTCSTSITTACKHYLWPIFHYLLPMTQAQGSLFDRSHWKAYTKVNKISLTRSPKCSTLMRITSGFTITS